MTRKREIERFWAPEANSGADRGAFPEDPPERSASQPVAAQDVLAESDRRNLAAADRPLCQSIA
jgi:hypothetical protein